MRVKLIKDWDNHKKGEVVNVSRKQAEWIVETGSGLYSKDMAVQDYKTKGTK